MPNGLNHIMVTVARKRPLCAKGFNAGEPKTTTQMTSETKQTVNVYTLPVCPNCSVLKKSLMEHGISFEEHDLDSPQSRTTLLMERGLYNRRAGAPGQGHLLNVR